MQGDIVLQSKNHQNLATIFKIIFYFPRESEFRRQKTNNYESKGVTFPLETEYDVGFLGTLSKFVKSGNTVKKSKTLAFRN